MTRYIPLLLLLPLFLFSEEPKKPKPPKFSDIEIEFRGHTWNVVWMKHSSDCQCGLGTD